MKLPTISWHVNKSNRVWSDFAHAPIQMALHAQEDILVFPNPVVLQDPQGQGPRAAVSLFTGPEFAI